MCAHLLGLLAFQKSYSGCESDLYSLRLDTVGKNFNCDTLETNWARLLLPYGVPFLDGEYDEKIQEEKVKYATRKKRVENNAMKKRKKIEKKITDFLSSGTS